MCSDRYVVGCVKREGLSGVVSRGASISHGSTKVFQNQYKTKDKEMGKIFERSIKNGDFPRAYEFVASPSMLQIRIQMVI